MGILLARRNQMFPHIFEISGEGCFGVGNLSDDGSQDCAALAIVALVGGYWRLDASFPKRLAELKYQWRTSTL